MHLNFMLAYNLKKSVYGHDYSRGSDPDVFLQKLIVFILKFVRKTSNHIIINIRPHFRSGIE